MANEITGFAERFRRAWSWLLRGEDSPRSDTEKTRNLESVLMIKAKYAGLWNEALKAEGKDEMEIDNIIMEMIYYRLHLCFYESSDWDIYCRKAFLVSYAAQILSLRTLSLSIIPAKSFLAADVDEIAIAYKTPPERWIENESGEEQEDKTNEMNSIYETMNAGARFNEIFRRAYIVNHIIVRPMIERKENGVDYRIEYLTPDVCMYTLDAHDDISSLAYPVVVNGIQTIKFWKANGENYYRSAKDGKRIEGEGYDFDPTLKIPFVLMRVREGKTTIYSAVEANLQVNYADLQNIRNLTFNTSPIGVATNCKIADGQTLNASDFFSIDGLQANTEVPPKFEWAQPQLVLNEVEEYRRKLRTDAGANEGRPLSAFIDSAQVQSGISRQLEREVLYNKRETHLEYLKVFERKFFEMLVLLHEEQGIVSTLKDMNFNVDFSEITEPDDPTKEFDLLVRKAEKNIITYADIVMRYDTDVNSYEEAQARLVENKKKNDALKSRGLFAALLEPPANGNGMPPPNKSVADIATKIMEGG